MPPRTRAATRHTPARSLAEDLRARSDDQLTALLVARPDLARPTPADLTALAARASTRASVQRAVERLHRGLWHTVQASVVAAQGGAAAEQPVGAVDPAQVATLLGASRAAATAHLNQLWELALLWRSARGLELTRTLAETLGPHPGGLGLRAADVDPRYAAHHPPEGAALAQVFADAPAEALAVLDRLTWAGPTGHVPAGGAARHGADWLLGQGLVAPSGVGHVTLVREVALARRGGRLRREPGLDPPRTTPTPVDPADVDTVAAGAARELLDRVDELAGLLGNAPMRVLRAGGMSARDVARLAKALEVPDEQAAWLVETAHAAGLLADDGELVPMWAPTSDFDQWWSRPAGARWAGLIRAWLASPRAAHLCHAPGQAATALGPAGHWPGVRAVRSDVLAQLAAQPSGTALPEADVLALLAWHRPLRDPVVTGPAVVAVLRELAWLGLTGLGSLGRVGRALAADASEADLAEVAAGALPGSVDHVLLQADLTAIAPGPLEGDLAAFMRLVADIESRGGAMVLRFTPESLRRAFDAGWAADDVLEQLAAASRTPVPQPLEYLVRDVARRHGQTRVGGATAYLRCDDGATLTQMLADRRLAPAMLRRIAPTVLISRAEPATLLDVLREAGYAPAQEAFDGTLIVAPPAVRRSRSSRERTTSEAQPSPAAAAVGRDHARSVVAALRSAPPRPEPGQAPARVFDGDPADTGALLRLAASDALAVWLGYADANGRTTRHLVRPVRVDGGRVYAVCEDSEAEQLFLLHRITGAALA